jgi:hypothetical protein
VKIYTHIRMVRNTDMDGFVDEICKRSEELQARGFQLEYVYKPLIYKGFFKRKIIYTCMIKAYEN